ncbi:hypothetical protein HanRHA438_Chr09g0400391 [Helianthus annuus]|nr:hypothetical protein HanIR_Chr09g0419141 [Helianthus annuus]KAJ0888289.1 hypothetical protein HanRHA438_Chr09g0400391 [Helianthus annuus]
MNLCVSVAKYSYPRSNSTICGRSSSSRTFSIRLEMESQIFRSPLTLIPVMVDEVRELLERRLLHDGDRVIVDLCHVIAGIYFSELSANQSSQIIHHN